jgi:hypothetical protein
MKVFPAQKKPLKQGLFSKNGGSVGREPETTGPLWCAPPVCKAAFSSKTALSCPDLFQNRTDYMAGF